MTVSNTTRFGLTRWSADTDEFTRSQMDASHSQIETLGAVFRQGLDASKGTASAALARSFYWATDTSILYFCDGSSWQQVTPTTNTSPLDANAGSAASAGSALTFARSDHRHSNYPFGTSAADTGLTGSAGTANQYARADHVHAIGAGSVVAGDLGISSINASNLFTSGVVDTAAIRDGNVTKGKIEPSQQIPAGIIMAFAGTTLPTGWLWCDGASYAQTSQPDLFAAIGSRYGSTGASFNVPDLRDQFPRGAATTSASVTVTGADTITLTAANLPVHTHPAGTLAVTNTAHSHVLSLSTQDSTNLSHTHTITHTHRGALDSNLVTGGTGTFGNAFLSPGSGSGIYASGKAADGAYEMVSRAPLVADTGVGTTSQSTNSSGSTTLQHSHSISGTTQDTTPTSTISGSTGQNTGGATVINVQPRSVTVNYIIKT